MFATSSALASIAGAFSDTGVLVGVIVTAIVAGVVALMGVGMALRKLRKNVTGGKL